MSNLSQKFPGLEHLVRLLSKSSPIERRKLLRTIGKHHPDQFPEIFRQSFQAEDIEFFSKKQLLELADVVDNTVIALVLFELSSEFQTFFLGIINTFKAKEIKYILENFSHADIHKNIEESKEHLKKVVKANFL